MNLDLEHRRFLDFVAAFYRDSGLDEPVFDSDPYTPVAFEVDVDDVTFSVGYDPFSDSSGLFVYCVSGVPAASMREKQLISMLESNLSLQRYCRATCCIDARTQELACYMCLDLDEVDVVLLKQQLEQLAERVRQWRDLQLIDADAALEVWPMRMLA